MESSGSVGAPTAESKWMANLGDVGGQKAVVRTEVRGEVRLCLVLAQVVGWMTFLLTYSIPFDFSVRFDLPSWSKWEDVRFLRPRDHGPCHHPE